MASASAQFYSTATQSALWLLTKIDSKFGNSVIPLNIDESPSTPHQSIKQSRKKGDILRSYTVNGWYVLGYDQVQELLRDERLSSAIADNKFINLIMRSAARGLTVPFLDHPNMLQTDAPDHTRLRKLTAQKFTRKYVQSLTPSIEALVDELMSEIPECATQFDVIDTIARPLPAIVIAQMLGVPKEERHLFEQWSADMVGLVEILKPDQIRKAVEAELAMRDYLGQLAEHKRANPGQDLISELIAAEEDGDRLTLEELYSTCEILLIAGHETTTRLIGNCLHLLMQHPEQLKQVRASDESLDAAIEETLRFEPPVMALSRTVAKTFVYQGKKFAKGQVIMLSIAGASRDPKANANPDAFDVHRENITHVSFGHGVHLCLGMTLARIEAKVAIRKLLHRHEYISAADNPPKWESNPFFRGLEQLNINIGDAHT